MFKIKTLLFLVVLASGIGALSVRGNATELTTVEAAELLGQSVGVLSFKGKDSCTAWKVGSKTWVTAAHCVSLIGEYKIETNEEPMGYTLFVRSVLKSLEKPDKKGVVEDWGVVATTEARKEVPSLEVDCLYKPVIGEKVAYYGFPDLDGNMYPMFSVEEINSLHTDTKEPFYFVADFTGGPGASGSPVIAMSTGKVIGILTTGIMAKFGLLSVGMETVKGMDMCLEPIASEVADSNRETIIYHGSF